jgi:hypothetical protein
MCGGVSSMLTSSVKGQQASGWLIIHYSRRSRWFFSQFSGTKPWSAFSFITHFIGRFFNFTRTLYRPI